MIRNFVIISHVDHGKSTLADRLLEVTGTIEKTKLVPQFLDRMPLERERGITIKMQPVRMAYTSIGKEYILNLIDTPGHSDFSYEVSRGLAAVEGAILLVDATKGVQAQTLANFHLARAQGLTIIPAINKIDLPTARIAQAEAQFQDILGIDPGDVLRISGKTGAGVAELLDEAVRRIPAPKGDAAAPLRALVFDSHFDVHRGIIAYVRVFEGTLKKEMLTQFFHARASVKVGEVGVFRPDLAAVDMLGPGEIGYIATGLKDASLVRVGDTIINRKSNSKDQKDVEPLAGYKEPQPLVFASLYPTSEDGFSALKTAIEKLHLNDAAFSFQEDAGFVSNTSKTRRRRSGATENSAGTLGRGFRCGFLGTLHQEIVEERLRREYQTEVIVTQPSVVFEVVEQNGAARTIERPSELDRASAKEIREPWLRLNILLPPSALPQLMKLLPGYRAQVTETKTMGAQTVALAVEIPLAEFFTDFAERLQSAVSGYASFYYEPIGMRAGDLVVFEILVHGEPQAAFTQIIHRLRAQRIGRERVEKLKALMPRGLFPVALQAVVNGTIIARETVPALRKDVTGYLYGGDYTRKRKLLEKQKAGKKLLGEKGNVTIPPAVFRQMAH
ncbi:MAG: translation elongation factor 4 [bacterium]|nr:translation elongation factor 4 [bacterium]MDZ4295874.1 translation elongation factor 4 [Patescibacteria group bacterium]